MSTLAERLKEAARQLELVTETPRLDAEILLAHALNLSRAQLLARLRDDTDAPEFEKLIARRLNHEPIAYITGHCEFFSLDFLVRPPMLVPRPETEHLVEAVLAFLGGHANAAPSVLDIGTGTGCVAIAIAANAPHARITATDLRAKALELANENAQRHRVNLTFLEGDLFAAFPENTPAFDVIVSNPPYVETADWETLSPVIRKHEDPGALLAGADGLEVIRRIVTEAPRHLHTGGLLALEIGERQSRAVAALLAGAGFRNIYFVRDLSGIERIACGNLKTSY